ncbi:MAG: SIS domain-containing protein [Polynucleobacter sp.]|nr:SIS domain-containing protein [Polynucleobacter sp.]
MKNHISLYLERLIETLSCMEVLKAEQLGFALLKAWRQGNSIYLCGNGGSAGNAIHLANDLIFGAGIKFGKGLRVEALSANPAVLTCLANDIGYDQIFAEQIRVKGRSGDVLIALSGSGNSSNILKALEIGNELGLVTFAILGFDGGKAKNLAQHPIHIPVQDMQIAEDLQLIIGHICMQWLCENPPSKSNDE